MKTIVKYAMEKSANMDPAAAALFGGGAASIAVLLALLANKERREAIGGELKDPRLYSNLRGMATLESREDRVAAHKGLSKNKDGGVLSAMHKGFTRQ